MDWEKIKVALVRFYKKTHDEEEPSKKTLELLAKGFNKIVDYLKKVPGQDQEDIVKFNKRIEASILGIIATLEKNLSLNNDMVLMRSSETEAATDSELARITWLINTAGINPQDATLANMQAFHQQVLIPFTEMTDEFDSVVNVLARSLHSFNGELQGIIKSELKQLKADLLQEIESKQFNLRAADNINFDKESFKAQVTTIFDAIDSSLPGNINPETKIVNTYFDYESFSKNIHTLMIALRDNTLEQNLKIKKIMLLVALEIEVTLKMRDCHVPHISFDLESMRGIGNTLATKLQLSSDMIQRLNEVGFGTITAEDMNGLDEIKKLAGYKDDAFDAAKWNKILSSETKVSILGKYLSLSYQDLEHTYHLLINSIMPLLKHSKANSLQEFMVQDYDTRENIASFIDSRPNTSALNSDEQIFLRGNSFFKSEDNFKLLLPLAIAISLRNESDYERNSGDRHLPDEKIVSAFDIYTKNFKRLQGYLLGLIKYKLFNKQGNADYYDSLRLFGITEMSNLDRGEFIKKYQKSDDPQLMQIVKDAKQINEYIKEQYIQEGLEGKDLATLKKTLVVLGEKEKKLLQMITEHHSKASKPGSPPMTADQQTTLRKYILRMCLYRETINLIRQKLASQLQDTGLPPLVPKQKPKNG